MKHSINRIALSLSLLFFSSGSTGVPKGIMYDHAWLMGGCHFLARDLQVSATSHCLLRCSYVWSVSVYDLFPANMCGGTLFIPPPGGHQNVQYMAQTIEREAIQVLVIQPTLLDLLLEVAVEAHHHPGLAALPHAPRGIRAGLDERVVPAAVLVTRLVGGERAAGHLQTDA